MNTMGFGLLNRTAQPLGTMASLPAPAMAPSSRASVSTSTSSSSPTRPSKFESYINPTDSKTNIDSAPVRSPKEARQKPVKPLSEDEREKLMTHFLTQLQLEFGVEPEEFVKAFASLDVETLMLPPEESAPTVIDQLKLSPEQKTKAQTLYSEMLTMSAAAGLTQYLKETDQIATMAVLSPQQALQQERLQKISTMSDSFFANPAFTDGQGPVKPDLTKLQKAQSVRAYQESMGAEAIVKPRQDLLADSSTAPAGAFDISSLGPQEEVVINTQNASASAPRNLEAQPKAQKAVQDLISQSQIQPQGDDLQNLISTSPHKGATPTVNGATSSALNSTSSASVLSAPVQAASAAASSQMWSESSPDGTDEHEQSFDEQAIANPVANNETKVKHNSPSFMVEAPKADPQDVQANVKDVISKAQFLATKGGGEMKVQMTPEGLGEVHLKVKLNQGEVSVDILASNNETKKMLEKGLVDLRANLALQNLKVDQIKVEGQQEISQHLQQQAGQDPADRQFQQKFLQDFRENNNNFRRQFYDQGVMRVPGSQIQDEASNSRYNPGLKKSARRLDLVA